MSDSAHRKCKSQLLSLEFQDKILIIAVAVLK